MIYCILFLQEDLIVLAELYRVSRIEIQELRDQIRNLEEESRAKDEKIAELASLQNPFSIDGEAVCNSYY